MASSSTSSTEKMFKYDVFLSFRGEDTRKNFVGHLYHALQQKGIETYKDDERIEQGKTINDQLIRSIEESRFFIIVFSKTYASSSWCLDELVKIMECKKTTEQNVYPVFFDVEPTEVRKQSGALKEAFAEHEKKEAAGKWREAMKEASDLAGWELKATANGDESKLIQIIVDVIFNKKCSTLSNTDGNLVGMETRIRDVLSSLDIGTEDVRMIGIKGMGGGGKTTLARAVYDRLSTIFEGKSFVENVREVSHPSLSGLKKLQKRILKDVLNKQDITFSSVHDGKNMLIDMMSRRKTLVVLDDVDRIDQLEALAGEPDWFKAGSRIIITTRDEQVLLAHRVNCIHDVNLLSSMEAICLFSRYAFKREIPTQGYEELSGQVVQYAHGLPLTIKVMGSFLCCQSEPFWIDAIERLKTIPFKDTMDRLEISFDGLEKEYKEIFLDVACILKGWPKEDAIRVLESCGFHAKVGLRVIEQKSLITYKEDEELWMHDHLEEMGRNIVRRSHPDEPQRHSRLWVKEEIKYILTNDLGTQATKCLYFESPGFNAEIAMKGLAKMKDLIFIHINIEEDFIEDNIVQFDKVSEYLPSSLRFMRWDGFPFSSLPNTFQGKYLVELYIGGSNIVQIWEDGEEKVLHKLRFLTFYWCSKLQSVDLRLASNLEQLTIDFCKDFRELHIPADHHSKLEYLSLTYSKLKNLHLGNTPNLETLKLDGCNDLVELQMPVESLKLKYLDVSNSELNTIHLGNTPNLERLILEGCNDLVELQMPAESPKLEVVDLRHSKFKTIHLGNTLNLEKLKLKGCNDLVELEMPSECLKLEKLYLSHSKLRTLDLGLTPNLKWLYLENCYDLVEISAPIGCLKKLLFLDLSGCGRFKSFVFNKWFQEPEAGSISELHLIAKPTDVCPLHSDNDSPKFLFECYYKEDPDSSFGNLERLISLGMCACTNLESFSRSICGLQCLTKLTLKGSIPEVPRDLDQLECLEELTFSSTEIKHLPDSICMLKHLKSLKLDYCVLLEKLPEDLGQLECLETLFLIDCKLLEEIPNSICKMKCINKLHLHGCIRVVELPEDIGCLEGLKELNIVGTGITHLPQSIFRLRGLRIVLLGRYGLLIHMVYYSRDEEPLMTMKCFIFFALMMMKESSTYYNH